MNTNKEQLNNAINNLASICPKGREEVRALVETITGVKLKEEERLELIHRGLYSSISGKDQVVVLQQFDKDNWAIIWFNGTDRSHKLINRDLFGDAPNNPMPREKLLKLLTDWNYTFKGLIRFTVE